MTDNRPAVKVPPFAQPGARVLVTRFKSIGDILFTLPAVHALRENYPDIKITFLTSNEFRPLVGCFRDVDEVLTIDRSMYRRGNILHIARETFSLLRLLRQKSDAEIRHRDCLAFVFGVDTRHDAKERRLA